jgi:hypothetical protein
LREVEIITKSFEPCGSKIITTGVQGRRDDMTFTWPLWSIPATMATTRSALQVDWTGGIKQRAARGVFAICRSAIRRTKQGRLWQLWPLISDELRPLFKRSSSGANYERLSLSRRALSCSARQGCSPHGNR